MSLKVPGNVMYFAAVMYDPVRVLNPEEMIISLWGNVVLQSGIFDFDHTTYYEPEMGQGLKKYFAAFGIPAEPGFLVDYKLKAIELENSLALDGRRIINIDPGYLAVEKVVVASTKNFTHRIYLGGGIYGDLQLMRQKGRYTAMPWTYADYIRPEAEEFFQNLYRSHLA